MEDLVKKRDKLSEKLKQPQYWGALKRIADASGKSYGYVRQVLIIKDRWSDHIISTAPEVLKSMDNEKKLASQKKVVAIDRALA